MEGVERVSQPAVVGFASERGHDPQSWLERFKSIRDRGELWMEIWKQTQTAFSQGSYLAGDKRVQFNPTPPAEMQRCTEFLTQQDIPIRKTAGSKFTRYVILDQGDLVEEAAAVQQQGLNPVLINLADRESELGLSYIYSEEAEYCRRSDYSYVIDPKHNPSIEARYQVREAEVIYTPRVTFVRGRESWGYPFLKEPVQVAVITSFGADVEMLLGAAVAKGHNCVLVSYPSSRMYEWNNKANGILDLMMIYTEDVELRRYPSRIGVSERSIYQPMV